MVIFKFFLNEIANLRTYICIYHLLTFLLANFLPPQKTRWYLLVPPEAKSHIKSYYYLLNVTLRDKPLVSLNQQVTGSIPVRLTLQLKSRLVAQMRSSAQSDIRHYKPLKCSCHAASTLGWCTVLDPKRKQNGLLHKIRPKDPAAISRLDSLLKKPIPIVATILS